MSGSCELKNWLSRSANARGPHVGAAAAPAVLEEDGPARVFEDGVGERIALGDLLLDFDVESSLVSLASQ